MADSLQLLQSSLQRLVRNGAGASNASFAACTAPSRPSVGSVGEIRFDPNKDGQATVVTDTANDSKGGQGTLPHNVTWASKVWKVPMNINGLIDFCSVINNFVCCTRQGRYLVYDLLYRLLIF